MKSEKQIDPRSFPEFRDKGLDEEIPIKICG